MRPNNQQKNRSRNRNNNNGQRKHLNPLSRNFESNGPDIKIRGNAAHIAEKYVQLARDAQSAGDSVMEQNYLQHAEHYFRIVSASQPATPVRQDNDSDDGDDETNDTGNNSGNESAASPAEATTIVEVDAGAGEADGADGEQTTPNRNEGQPRRERRPRRRPASAEGEGNDLASAPQPDVADLPAFIRAPSQSDAAE